MWSKISKRISKKESYSQIGRSLDLDRRTVKLYSKMSLEDFILYKERHKVKRKKLDSYFSFFKEQLKKTPDLHNTTIADRVLEKSGSLPDVCDKTFYNYIEYLRVILDLPKPAIGSTHRHMIPECAYGSDAQVDFGVCKLLDSLGHSHKIHIFCMSLSRSRYKFVYFQNAPFRSNTAVYAQQLAHQYFEGVPERVIYDNDAVYVADMNKGDRKLTETFGFYCHTENFTPHFCQPYDPESKGKIENIVRYVKESFLKGRVYTTIDDLNSDVLLWLSRRGNGKRHSSTGLIPSEEWDKERFYLKPIISLPNDALSYAYDIRSVRKDHTIKYLGNYYSVPSGTYKPGAENQVKILSDDIELKIFDFELKNITSHNLLLDKYDKSLKPSHTSYTKHTEYKGYKDMLAYFDKSNIITNYLDVLHKVSPPNFQKRMDEFSMLIDQNIKTDTDKKIMLDAIQTQIERESIDPRSVLEYFMYLSQYRSTYQVKQNQDKKDTIYNDRSKSILNNKLTPDKTDIETFSLNG